MAGDLDSIRGGIDAIEKATRRRRHEKRAAEMSAQVASMTSTSPADLSELDWEQSAVRATIDAGLSRLRQQDRRAILLRFYERLTFLQVGERLGVDEEAARKRVVRAVSKLRELIGKKGGVVTAVGLATILSTKLSQAAPIGLAAHVATTALSQAPCGRLRGGGRERRGPSLPRVVHRPNRRTTYFAVAFAWFACYAISGAMFFGGCSLLVHKLIFHDRQDSQNTQVHRD